MLPDTVRAGVHDLLLIQGGTSQIRTLQLFQARGFFFPLQVTMSVQVQ